MEYNINIKEAENGIIVTFKDGDSEDVRIVETEYCDEYTIEDMGKVFDILLCRMSMEFPNFDDCSVKVISPKED